MSSPSPPLPPDAEFGAAVARLQAHYLRAAEPRTVFDALLPDLLQLTGSEYGFIAEVWTDADGQPYLKLFTLTDIAWDEASRRMLDEHRDSGLEFRNLRSLLGVPLTTGEPVISNQPAADPRRGGMPPGHPALRAYLGMPVRHGGALVGVVGLANRPGGYDSDLLRRLDPLFSAVGAVMGQVQLERERRQAEEALRRSEALYRTIFESSQVGIAHVDLQGRLLDANPRLCQMLGRPAEELRQLRFHEISHADDLPRDLALLEELLAGQRASYALDKRFLRPDGSVVWTLLTVGLVRDAAGRPLHLVSSLQDIGERKQAEAALRESRERLRKLTDGIDGAIFMVQLEADGAMRLLHASRGIRRLFRLPEDAAGEPPDLGLLMQRVEPEDLAQVLQQLRAVYQSLEPLHEVYRVHLEDGLHWHETRATAERDADGRVLLYGFTFDVTERKQYEQALMAAEAAERANRAKTEFLSRMSHELRTPLNAVLGFSQLLQLDVQLPLTATQRSRVEHIERAGQHLLAMINDVLDLSRIEQGALALHPEVLPVAQSVQEASELLETLARDTGIRLLPPCGDAAATVRGDRLRLRQALVNLLSNAIKYNRPGGEVGVSWQDDAQRPGWLRISVRDTGRGLSEAQRGRLFEPFNRLGAERTAVQGTGIGLLITQRLVQLMNGELQVDSTAGVGSCFTIVLPLADAAATAPLPLASEPDPPPPAHASTVLYAEDNLHNAALVRELMRLRPQVRLLVVPKGHDVLRLAREQPPCLLLIDWHLGDAAAQALCRQLDADPALARCPRVALSADATPERAGAAGCGFVAYLTKPLEMRPFLECLDRFAGPAAG
ncbi:PAS domain S-box protein [Eleftheria terrae]|uniref:PAS domain S-box protein n=1 Tax=Eleftheria terrae TaxID=1597781 RepID=UPI00263BA093|nr:PAS domain S-box protein [Eleftheria terrae]WKB53608.1 PAS domain S-box protein [Eleftheria terrae]